MQKVNDKIWISQELVITFTETVDGQTYESSGVYLDMEDFYDSHNDFYGSEGYEILEIMHIDVFFPKRA